MPQLQYMHGGLLAVHQQSLTGCGSHVHFLTPIAAPQTNLSGVGTPMDICCSGGAAVGATPVRLVTPADLAALFHQAAASAAAAAPTVLEQAVAAASTMATAPESLPRPGARS